MAAAIGNQYAAKEKLWRAAINRALGKRSGGDKIMALDDLAEKLLTACDQGDLAALKELGDRLDGKPAQSVAVANEGDEPFRIEKIVREIVRTPNSNG
jgi:hypothetical protein